MDHARSLPTFPILAPVTPARDGIAPGGAAREGAAGPEAPPDAALVRRARAGSAEAFGALYRQEAGRVYGLSLRLTGDRARAAELTQDVFVRAWERLEGFRGEGALWPWLRRIAVTTLLGGARAGRRRAARVALAGDIGDDPGASIDAAPARGHDVEAGIDLERAIAALPPGARLVFVLHDVEGYRHAEIARMTGTAEGTCRAQLHRARRLLMEALEP